MLLHLANISTGFASYDRYWVSLFRNITWSSEYTICQSMHYINISNVVRNRQPIKTMSDWWPVSREILKKNQIYHHLQCSCWWPYTVLDVIEDLNVLWWQSTRTIHGIHGTSTWRMGGNMSYHFCDYSKSIGHAMTSGQYTAVRLKQLNLDCPYQFVNIIVSPCVTDSCCLLFLCAQLLYSCWLFIYKHILLIRKVFIQSACKSMPSINTVERCLFQI